MATILVVDDRPENRVLVRAMLRHLGHRLLEAGDGAAALAVIRAERPDLVITDVLMPTMDGYELVRQVRSDPAIADTRVAFYTAHYREREAEALAKSCGVSVVLTKPTEPATFIAAVEALLGAEPSAGASPIGGDFDHAHARLLTDKLSGTADELLATNQRLSALIDLSLQLGSELDPSRLLNHFCSAAREIVGARQAVAGIVHAEDQRLRYLFTSGMEAEAAARMGSPDPGLPILRSIVRDGRSSRRDNPGGDPTALGFDPSFPAIHSWLGAPIASPSRTYGWLGLIDKVGGDGFTAEDERLATILAAQVGRVYQNGSLYADALRHASELEIEVAERERAEQRQAVLLAVNQALAESTTLQDAAARILAAIGERLAWEVGGLWLVDRTADVLRCLEAWQAPTVASAEWTAVARSSTFAREQGRLGNVWASGEPHWGADAAHEHDLRRAGIAERLGLNAGFTFPIIFNDDVLGVVEFYGTRAREPADDLLRTLSGISGPLGQFVQRQRLEEQVHQAQRRLEHVVASSPAVLFTLGIDDRSLRLTWISANVTEMLGWAIDEVYQDDWWTARLHPDDRDRVLAEIDHRLFGEGRVSDEYRFLHADGTHRWLRSEMRLAPAAAGGPREAVGSWSDITERKQLEDQFRQAQKMEAMGRLAGGVAHDFNNLLTVIQGYTTIASAQLRAGDPLLDFLDQIGKAGTRATHLTRQLLAFSRKQVLQPVVLDLNALVRNMIEMLRRVIGEDMALAFVPGDALWTVRADPGQVEQVIMNLVINARDAMRDGGTITIATENVTLGDAAAPREHVRLTITDTGSGMDAETKSRAFEPFFSTKGERGTGLGLATVFGIVQQSGGTVEVDSEVGVGTSFRIHLPRQAEGRPQQLEPMEPELTRGCETILVVEDEPDVRGLIVLMLRERGYDVVEASNAAEALFACERSPRLVDLLVTDVVMPNMSGRQLAERLLALHPDLKVLYVSGYTDDAIVHHGVLEAGVAFLNKPFTQEQLTSKVREVLDRSQQG